MTSPADDAARPAPSERPDREQSDEDNRIAVAAQTAAAQERDTARRQAETDQGVLREQINAFSKLSAQHVLDLTDASREQTASNIRVSESYDKYAASMRELQERSKLARRRYRVTILVLVVFFAALLVRQEVANQAAQDARRTLLDCIVPTGTCYKHSQKATAKVVGSLNQVATLAAACAPNYTGLPLGRRIDAIQHCILHHLH